MNGIEDLLVLIARNATLKYPDATSRYAYETGMLRGAIRLIARDPEVEIKEMIRFYTAQNLVLEKMQ